MQKGRVSFVTGNGSYAPLQRPPYACFWSMVVHCWAMVVAFEPFVQYFPPSSARRNQECDFHFATRCFSLCVLGEYQQSLEYLQFSLIQHLWNTRVSVPFVWHVLNAQCLHPHQAVPELPGSLYICNSSCDIPTHRRISLSPRLCPHSEL